MIKDKNIVPRIATTNITGKFHLKYTKENVMIEITITETAKIELFKVLEHFNAKSVRLTQQGFG